MRIGLFNGGRLGVVQEPVVRDVTDLVGSDAPQGPLHEVIRRGIRIDEGMLASAPSVPIADVAWDAPLLRPGKILGAPANYYEHVDEMPDSNTILDWGVFLKASTSVTGPGGVIELPYTDKRTDYEGELAVVIGRGGRDIPLDEALDHVYGYTGVLDITVRSTEDRSTRKSFDTFTPLGPVVVTADEFGDPGDVALRLEVNGELKQDSTTAKLIYSVPAVIAYASSVMTLEPGDVIATGTPAGVGPIVDGDVVTLRIDGIGELSVTVSGRRAIAYVDRPGPSVALTRA
ncbi:fumarylacetoacetate hydrolase family protein [Microbacterium sp. A196]|uniref:fumarylacetoacetate hydrolase family protein n=1 Tax=unclassified Microbacterium TaxID=2609290 RepID=UPI003FD46984